MSSPARAGHLAPLPAAGTPASPGDRLPSWPFTLAFAGLPLWWVLGLLDFIWIPMAAVMVLYLVRARAATAPRIFGVWLLFLLFVACSVIGLSEAGQLLVFGYRLAIYIAGGVMFLYVYNARRALTEQFVAGVLTVWWLMTVAGGYVALASPTGQFRTVLSYVLPRSLVDHPWLNQMLVRPLNQYNPEGFFNLDPRPSAPFTYTNNWGSIYSLLLPFVLAYMLRVRGTRRFWLLALAIPVSLVPAILTTNRGMFLGLAVAGIYAATRMALRRDFRGVLGLAAVAVIAVVVFRLVPAADRLESRIEGPSTVDRASLYLQALDAVSKSPLFGYGSPIEGENNVDPVGTQGQFWMVLVSHGVVATALFMGWFALAFVSSVGRRTAVGSTANTVLLVALFEFGYYGFLPYGLPVIMVAAALALRPPDGHDAEQAPQHPARTSAVNR